MTRTVVADESAERHVDGHRRGRRESWLEPVIVFVSPRVCSPRASRCVDARCNPPGLRRRPAAAARKAPRQTTGAMPGRLPSTRRPPARMCRRMSRHYPLAVLLDKSRFDFSQARADGADIRFFDAGGKALPHAIELWDRASGSAAIWVLLDVVKGNSTGSIDRDAMGPSERARHQRFEGGVQESGRIRRRLAPWRRRKHRARRLQGFQRPRSARHGSGDDAGLTGRCAHRQGDAPRQSSRTGYRALDPRLWRESQRSSTRARPSPCRSGPSATRIPSAATKR